ncbi:MAG TPA: PadR family transcriptional regulator [Longimicrobiales bacterium]|nr:PadR family transcriptional regulator [Longimicrobiales bacterium]
MNPARHLPLPPRNHLILVALAESPLHGYGLLERLPEISDGRVRVGPASLYRLLDRMADEGLLETTGTGADAGSGPPRTVYRPTALGRAVLQAETDRLDGLVRRVRAGGGS